MIVTSDIARGFSVTVISISVIVKVIRDIAKGNSGIAGGFRDIGRVNSDIAGGFRGIGGGNSGIARVFRGIAGLIF